MATVEELETKYLPAIATVPVNKKNTEVIPHVDGMAYFGAIKSAIDATGAAGDAIYATSWYLDSAMRLDAPNPPTLGDLLATKAAAGVDVRVIVWVGRFLTGAGLADTSNWWETAAVVWPGVWVSALAGGLVEIARTNVGSALALRALKPGGASTPPLDGRVLIDHGGGRAGSRHQKYTVVYRKTSNDLRAFAGIDIHASRFANYQHPPGEAWHDAGVELRGDAARSVWNDFKTRWEETKSLAPAKFRSGGVVQPFNPTTAASSAVPLVQSAGNAISPGSTRASQNSVRVLRSYGPWKDSKVFQLPFQAEIPWSTLPSTGLQEVLAVYKKAIDAATTYLYVEDQSLNIYETDFWSHSTVFPRVASAVNRGVKVIFVVGGSPDPTDAAGGGLINERYTLSLQSRLLDLMDPGKRANFAMYRVDNVIVHSKVVLIDDEFLAIGSANFADRSMEGLDTELQVAVVDPETGGGSSLAKQLRIRLWADHLRVDPSDPTVKSELADLTKSLAQFDPAWGTGVTFPRPNSKLTRVTP